MSTRVTSPEKQRLRIRRIRITGWTALSALLTTIVFALAWAHVVYPADRSDAIALWQDPRVTIGVEDGALTLTPAKPTEGPLDEWVLVFYPGARVEPFSYLAPFVELVATDGLRLVIPDPPLNLAFTITRPASHWAALVGERNHLVVGGHSLGGVKACLEARDPGVSALLLHASYCANDLSATDLKVLTALGDRDGLTDASAVDEARDLLPPSHRTIVIEGANHASFGTYGPQEGDNPSTTDRDVVYEHITEAIRDLLVAEN